MVSAVRPTYWYCSVPSEPGRMSGDPDLAGAIAERIGLTPSPICARPTDCIRFLPQHILLSPTFDLGLRTRRLPGEKFCIYRAPTESRQAPRFWSDPGSANSHILDRNPHPVVTGFGSALLVACFLTLCPMLRILILPEPRSRVSLASSRHAF